RIKDGIQDDTRTSRLDLSETNVRHPAFSSDGKLVAAIVSDNKVAIWETNKGEIQPSIQETNMDDLATNIQHFVDQFALAPDGRLVAVSQATKDSSYDFLRLNVWNAKGKKVQLSPGSSPPKFEAEPRGPGPRLVTAAFSPDGKILAA